MKLVIICLLGVTICCLSPAIAQAQVPQLAAESPGLRSGQVQLGLVVGAGFATLKGDVIESLDLSSRTGAVVGACCRYWLRPDLALQIEAEYVQRGMSYKSWLARFTDDSVYWTEGAFDLDYLAFPLLLRKSFGTAHVRPSLVAGTEIVFLLNAMDNWDAPAQQLSGKTDYGDLVQSVGIGWTLGAGLDLDAGSGAVTFDLRYTAGLNGVGSESASVGLPDAKSRAFLVAAGYLFPF